MDSAADSTPAAGQPGDAAHPPPVGQTGRWIGRADIARIAGALQASAYVARAYLIQKENAGIAPPWARKQPNGHWLFDADYIQADARENRATLGITEAAKVLGATRRAIQTWVDDGVIQATHDQREKGATRRILREEFLRAVPELKQRLTQRSGATPGEGRPAPTAESKLVQSLEERAAQEEDRLAASQKRRMELAARRRRRLGQERIEAGKRLRSVEREEQRAAQHEARLKASFDARLMEAEQAARVADRRRLAAARRAQRTTAREQAAAAQETHLRQTLAGQLADWRRKSAARIARQLRNAREAWLRAAPPAAPAPSEDSRRKSAAAVADQLRRARDSQLQRSEHEREAVAAAKQIAGEVAQGRLDRYDAAIRFHDAMEQRAMPVDIRIAVMKQYFSK